MELEVLVTISWLSACSNLRDLHYLKSLSCNVSRKLSLNRFLSCLDFGSQALYHELGLQVMYLPSICHRDNSMCTYKQ